MTTVTSEVIHDGETGRWAYLVEGLDADGLTILSFDNRARAEQSLMAMRSGNPVFAKAGAEIHAMGGQ